MIPHRLNDARILMYSHDTFGLGHLRRCRAIAHSLVEHYKGLTVLIISGSQIAGAFGFKARVDFVKIPSVIKLHSGDYTSVSDLIDISDTLSMRESLIYEASNLFSPNIFVTDKEPLGLHGEVERTLRMLRVRGCVTVLGLRDVMDSPDLLREEWAKKNVTKKMSELYDEIWVYGPSDFWDPLQDITLPPDLLSRTHYTGFLGRSAGDTKPNHPLPKKFVLVTAGGGGDGELIMSLVLSAREYDKTFEYPLVMVTGPFMKGEKFDEIRRRASALPNVTVIDFDNELESIMTRCDAVVGMCGYNTFCEVISFDKPALYLPRTSPREEQLIRATRASELGACQILDFDSAHDPSKMLEALRGLVTAPPPSRASSPLNIEGLSNICGRVEHLLGSASPLRDASLVDSSA